MRILILNTHDSGGGAALAALRLTKALISAGHEARMLVAEKKSCHPHVYTVTDTFLRRLRYRIAFYIERLRIFFANGYDRSKLFHVSTATYGLDISRHPWVRDWADIIHIHWICQGFLSLDSLMQIAAIDKPCFWTMHDMWSATAICHHARDCEQYTFEGGCRNGCPQLNGHCAKAIGNRKLSMLQALRPHFIGCSRWIAETAQRSYYCRGLVTSVIPNAIDTKLFAPVARGEARVQIGIKPEEHQRIFLLFGAIRADDYRKGIHELITMLQRVRSNYPVLSDQLTLLVFGHLSDALRSAIPIDDIRAFGYIKKPEQMALLYNAADFFVTPSLEENLPNTIMESLSCGTPCLAFRVGGIPEMIIHRSTGYLADYQSSEDLAAGLIFLANHLLEFQEAMRDRCRRFVLDNYSETRVAEEHIRLYEQRTKYHE